MRSILQALYISTEVIRSHKIFISFNLSPSIDEKSLAKKEKKKQNKTMGEENLFLPASLSLCVCASIFCVFKLKRLVTKAEKHN